MRDWQTQVNDLTDIQKKIHLAFRQDAVDQQALRSELVKARRRAYEQELTLQARRVGCNKGLGRLTTGDALKEIAAQAEEESASIVATFNYDLVSAIQAIAAANPRANRNTYIRQLEAWDLTRQNWKLPQIAQWTEATARSKAKQDFYRMNGIDGVAVLEPRTAKEPICQGWINRNEVSLKEALKNPGPWHPFCPHEWVVRPEQVQSQVECQDLWLGE